MRGDTAGDRQAERSCCVEPCAENLNFAQVMVHGYKSALFAPNIGNAACGCAPCRPARSAGLGVRQRRVRRQTWWERALLDDQELLLLNWRR